MKKKKFLLSLMIIGFIFLLIGSAYAYFQFRKDSDSNIIEMGDVYLDFTQSNTLTLINQFPMTLDEACLRDDNYIDFSVSGKAFIGKELFYGIYVDHGIESYGRNRFNDNEISFQLTIPNYEEWLVKEGTLNDLDDALIYVSSIYGDDYEYYTNYRMRFWVNDSVIISDTKDGADYTTDEYKNMFASFNIRVETIEDEVNTLYNLVVNDAVLDNESSDNVSNSINIRGLASNTNGNGKYILNSTSDTNNPIVYYRGNVNNYVSFAGKCWNIIRTTETGGVKMIFRGNGACSSTIGTIGYLSMNLGDFEKAQAVGYMYGDALKLWNLSTDPSISSSALYADDYGYNPATNRYYLKGDIGSKNSDRRFTVNKTTNTEGNVLYFSHVNDKIIKIENGETLEELFSDLYKNEHDSNLKTNLETWFSNNLLDYQGLIEDTVYCNERDFTFNNDLNRMDFSSYKRFDNDEDITFSCPKNDSFTVSRRIGNGNNKYPIGLITMDELMLSGSISLTGENTNTYLFNTSGDTPMTMSPLFIILTTYNFVPTFSGGSLSFSSNANVRPVISLNGGAMVSGGTGSLNDPYVIR